MFRAEFDACHAFGEINAEGSGFAELISDGFNLLAHSEPCVLRGGRCHTVKGEDS